MRVRLLLLVLGLLLGALLIGIPLAGPGLPEGLLRECGPTSAWAGETLPPGPPWKTDWLDAKKEAISTGRPIFAYFTKKH